MIMYIPDIVADLVKRYKTRDPFELCDHLRIHILHHPLGEIRGYYIKRRREKYIVLSSSLTTSERTVVCGHELGHAILHTELSTPFYQTNTLFSKDKFEMQANLFAADLLIPDELIYQYEGFTIRQIAYAEGLNEELLRLKFNR